MAEIESDGTDEQRNCRFNYDVNDENDTQMKTGKPGLFWSRGSVDNPGLLFLFSTTIQIQRQHLS
jgi:hypothetical protein